MPSLESLSDEPTRRDLRALHDDDAAELIAAADSGENRRSWTLEVLGELCDELLVATG